MNVTSILCVIQYTVCVFVRSFVCTQYVIQYTVCVFVCSLYVHSTLFSIQCVFLWLLHFIVTTFISAFNFQYLSSSFRRISAPYGIFVAMRAHQHLLSLASHNHCFLNCFAFEPRSSFNCRINYRSLLLQDIVEYLLEQGANINATNKTNCTAFFAAVGCKKREIAEVNDLI